MDGKLTQSERGGMLGMHNLTDGHAHQDQSPYQSILDRLPELYAECVRVGQGPLQEEFEATFFRYAGQSRQHTLPAPLYNYACSLSIEVVANFLQSSNLSVSLIQPTFDNLADILKRNQVRLESLSEDWFTQPFERAKEMRTDALFMVCPNNPTGLNVSRDQFATIVDFCALHGKLLIIDFSFRFYSDFVDWDQYALLHDSGIDFIAMEDTGKTWPTLELKVGLTTANQAIFEQLLDINDDFLLNVSPFAIKLLNEYIQVDALRSGTSHAQCTVDYNRNGLRRLIEGTPLSLATPDSRISVEWLQLPKEWLASELCPWLTYHDVHVLPGMPFYWRDPTAGESFVRLSLARDHAQFDRSASRFTELVSTYQPSNSC